MFPCGPAVLTQHNISDNTEDLRSVIRKRAEGLQSAESFLDSLRQSAAPRMLCTCSSSQNEKKTQVGSRMKEENSKNSVSNTFYKRSKRNTQRGSNISTFCIQITVSFWFEYRLICVSYAQYCTKFTICSQQMILIQPLPPLSVRATSALLASVLVFLSLVFVMPFLCAHQSLNWFLLCLIYIVKMFTKQLFDVQSILC